MAKSISPMKLNPYHPESDRSYFLDLVRARSGTFWQKFSSRWALRRYLLAMRLEHGRWDDRDY